MARSLIDIVTLDLRIEEEISKYGTLKDFHIVLWRQDPDTTGCNWNAHIERIGGSLTDSSWWDVVPQMRERRTEKRRCTRHPRTAAGPAYMTLAF